MKKASVLYDSRIQSINVLVEMNISEYVEIVQDVLLKNEFQRRKVRSSKTVYALLKNDLLQECVIPPIVLALTKSIEVNNSNDAELKADLISNKDSLVILDGLQRTYTILELLSELTDSNDEENIVKLNNTKLRVEIYIGLNRLGVLYRMLTLNTGQTPMSLRQQIEMLYLDYLDIDIDGLQLIRETDETVASLINQYNFKDIIEGFNAYLDRDELPIDKADILENINSLEKLAKENQSTHLFEQYLSAVNNFIVTIVDICGDAHLSQEYIDSKSYHFGKNALQIFKKPQAISGFGAAIGKLIDFGVLQNIQEVNALIDQLTVNDKEEFLEVINDSLLWLKDNSKKIGNAQRTFFAFFFRDLLNRDANEYLNLILACKSAVRKYQAQYM